MPPGWNGVKLIIILLNIPCMIPHTVWHSKLQEKDFAECLILPTVDEDVDAGVEDEQEVGDDGHHLAPGWPGVYVYSPLRCQVKHLERKMCGFEKKQTKLIYLFVTKPFKNGFVRGAFKKKKMSQKVEKVHNFLDPPPLP